MSPSQVNTEISDIEIIKRVLEGDIEVYADIVRRYNGYLYKVGKSYGFRHSEIEDLMQDAYVKAFLNLQNFQNKSSFKTWLVTIMLNGCYHKAHKSTYKNEFFTDSEFEENVHLLFGNTNNQTGNIVQNHELKSVIEEAIYKIPENYRVVFTLRELNGMSVRETAEALEISESNVKVRFSRAKEMLRSEIKKSYTPREIFEFNLIYCEPLVERIMESIRGLKK